MKLTFSGEQPELERLIYQALSKQVQKKHKEPKGKAEDGEYCPKVKPGMIMGWSHTQKKNEEDETNG